MSEPTLRHHLVMAAPQQAFISTLLNPLVATVEITLIALKDVKTVQIESRIGGTKVDSALIQIGYVTANFRAISVAAALQAHAFQGRFRSRQVAIREGIIIPRE